MRRHIVEDLVVLKALAHPIRLEALGRLRSHGPATASELGRVLGESSGSLSYHLRQLERFGFIADDTARDGRERRWQAVDEATVLPKELGSTPEGRAALQVVKGVQRQALFEQFAAVDADPHGLADHSDYLLSLDAAEVDALTAELHDVVERYTGRSGEHRLTLHVVLSPMIGQ